MNSAVHCYNSAGSRAYSIYLPAPLLTMVAMEVPHARMAKCAALALANGEGRRAARLPLLCAPACRGNPGLGPLLLCRLSSR